MSERIEKTVKFLLECFEHPNEYWNEHPEHKTYRIEHSFRVAHIGAAIAEREGLDRDATVVACLLHDVSYAFSFENEADYGNHGRKSAKISRSFVEGLGFSAELCGDILYGIAIHCDDTADFEGERTPLALTVSDADNIDRFDCVRIYEGVQALSIETTPAVELVPMLEKRISRLAALRDLPFGTAAGKEMWQDKVDFQTEFFKRMLAQMMISGAEGL